MQDIGKEEQETAETEVSEQGVQEVPGTTPQDGTEPVADRARRDPSWNEEGAIEAILFAMGDSVELNRLASAIGLSAAETKKIIDKAYKRAEDILKEHIDKLHVVAGILLEKEKIDGEEFAKVFEE